jgi:hypothetical protein
MHPKMTTPTRSYTIAILFVFVIGIGGCSKSGNLTNEVSGKWQTEQGNSVVEINLADDSSSLTIDGHSFKGVVDKIDNGNNVVHINVETEGGNKEEWTIHQVWNDNGSAFKLILRRNDTTDTLVPVGRS